MDLEKLSVEIRPRSPWEAMDMGFVLARGSFWPLWGLWLMTAVPVVLMLAGLAFFLPGSALRWVWGGFWLFKPFYEPALLVWISRAVFGEKRTTRKRLGGVLGRMLKFPVLWTLLLTRLNPFRAVHAPVLFLEQLTGAARRKRVKILLDNWEAAVFLTCLGAAMELVLAVALLVVFLWVVPESLRWVDFGAFVFSAEGWIFFAAYVLCCAFSAPFYVCAGFMMYLSRRVALEAWDIEIGFRNMRRQLADTQKGTALSAVLLGVFLCLFSPDGHATPYTPEQARQEIRDVLENKAFGREVVSHHWVPKKKEENKKQGPWGLLFEKLLKAISDFMKAISPVLALSGKWLLVVCGGVLAGLVILKYEKICRWLGLGRSTTGPHRPLPDVLFGLNVNPESLPRDIAGTSRQLVAEGRKVEALSLLYRATLSALVHRHHIEIKPSQTENECCGEVLAVRPAPEAAFFRKLTALWILAAYGHRDPDARACTALISQWGDLYGGA